MNDSESKTIPILLVDDEMQILISYSFMLKSAGIKDVVTLEDPRMVIPFIIEHKVSIIVLDLSMPFISGKDLLIDINRDFPEIPVIVVTATNEIETAVECMQKGALDYIVKPVERNRFISSIERALEIRNLKNEVSELKKSLLSDNLRNESAFSHIVTANKKMYVIFRYIEAIADSPFPVLIAGETGVGKELISKAIHLSSSRSKSFVAVNVSGLDDSMFTDSLFGHKKGAFTSAFSHREGLISQAEGGTLFLDEIGDLSSQSQVKLLRLIQEKEYYPLGSDLSEKTDCRIVVATNRDLKALVKEEKFRKDLYYRFMAHQINIPPLRERKEDIPVLLNYFLQEASDSLKKKVPTPPPELITLLSTYEFPGNIRELQALVYDAVSRHEGGILSMKSFKNLIDLEREDIDLNSVEDQKSIPIDRFLDNFPTLKRAEEYLIGRALKYANGNQGIAASMLGLTRQALNKRLIRKNKKKKRNG
jgi:DNA-binding NtrC family response regulator